MKTLKKFLACVLSVALLATCALPTVAIAVVPAGETYETYDEIGFDDLFIGTESMAGRTIDGGDRTYTFAAASPTHSTVFRFRWIPGGSQSKFSVFFDDWVYPFCFVAKYPNQDGFGKKAGPNGAWHLVPSDESLIVNMDAPVVAGNSYDMEMGRLKVKSGTNKGKYYVYWKVNGRLIQSYYYGGVTNGVYGSGTALSNTVIISSSSGNLFRGIPVPETYEDHDEVGLDDLYIGEDSLFDQSLFGGSYICTYPATSPTYSVVFKCRWIAGGSEMKCRTYFDGNTVYPFCFAVKTPNQEGFGKVPGPNGAWHLVPSDGNLMVEMDAPVAAGNTYDMEMARLKVKNGANKGKYYVYWKVNGQLIQSYYYGGVTNGTYENGVALSNTIAIDFPAGNKFSRFGGSASQGEEPYADYTHQGTRGDFDGNLKLEAADLVGVQAVLLGKDTGDSKSEMADFNNDGCADVRDLVAMKKYLIPTANYEKSGSLTVGIQEHLLRDETKTAAYIADASATLGAKSYRLSLPIDHMYQATVTNGVTARPEWLAECRKMVKELNDHGINEILYVSDEFVLPYGYAEDSTKAHAKTVPDPETDPQNYRNWLKVNAAAYQALAREFPEIKFFEPFNEINVSQGSRLEKYGIGWDATTEEQAAYKYTVQQRAGIMADLCWYVSRAVKSVDRANQVTTPSVSFNVESHVENDFLAEFYNAIESGAYPRGQVCGDINTNDYFTIINIHSYKKYSKDNSNIDDWVAEIDGMYEVVRQHNDAGKRVWMTETGCATKASRTNVGANIVAVLKAVDARLPYIDTVHIYQLSEETADSSVLEYGVFYSGTNPKNPYGIKDGAKSVYSYLHGDTINYLPLYALVKRYAG